MWKALYFDNTPLLSLILKKSCKILYTNDAKSESEIKETLPFTIATKRIKYLGTNLPKETKALYAEIYKTWEELQDGRRVRRGDRLPPHKYIRNTSTCGTTPTEHLLNAGRRPQTSQKARNSPRTWVGQKKKEITETKE